MKSIKLRLKGVKYQKFYDEGLSFNMKTKFVTRFKGWLNKFLGAIGCRQNTEWNEQERYFIKGKEKVHSEVSVLSIMQTIQKLRATVNVLCKHIPDVPSFSLLEDI